MQDHLNVAALVFPGMDQIDLTGPFAVLSRLPDSTVQLVWKDANPIRDYRGLRLIPDARFADARPVDLLVVPGGPGQEEVMEDDAVLSFVRDRAGRAGACSRSAPGRSSAGPPACSGGGRRRPTGARSTCSRTWGPCPARSGW